MLLATVGFIAGFVDTLAGGGGLITIPAFLFAGLSPGQALATNKCQAFAGTLTASLKLMASGHLKVRSLWPYATLAFGMALLGASPSNRKGLRRASRVPESIFSSFSRQKLFHISKWKKD